MSIRSSAGGSRSPGRFGDDQSQSAVFVADPMNGPPGAHQGNANRRVEVATLNWFIGSGIGYTNKGGAAISVSPDHHTVTLDLALVPVHSSATAAPGPEHATGAVTCA